MFVLSKGSTFKMDGDEVKPDNYVKIVALENKNQQAEDDKKKKKKASGSNTASKKKK